MSKKNFLAIMVVFIIGFTVISALLPKTEKEFGYRKTILHFSNAEEYNYILDDVSIQFRSYAQDVVLEGDTLVIEGDTFSSVLTVAESDQNRPPRNGSCYFELTKTKVRLPYNYHAVYREYKDNIVVQYDAIYTKPFIGGLEKDDPLYATLEILD